MEVHKFCEIVRENIRYAIFTEQDGKIWIEVMQDCK